MGEAAAGVGWAGGRDRKEPSVLVSNFGHRTSTFMVENFAFFPGGLWPREIAMPPSVPEGE